MSAIYCGQAIDAYHFTSDTLRNGTPIPPIDKWLEHEGPIEMCSSGLHASKHPLDALAYAPGNILHHVQLEGEIREEDDKVAGRRRKILKSIDATALLREFGRWCALQVVEHWDAPDIVIEYLKTGKEEIRAAARDAAGNAARDAWDAARDAAGNAAGAAWNAARDAGDAAWAARAAGTAAGAARAAGNAARTAAGNAARDAQRKQFALLVRKAFEGGE